MYFASSAWALALLTLFSATVAQDVVDCPFTPTFTSCLGSVPTGIDCASMNVPRDWTDVRENDYITLRLVRQRANVTDPNSAPAIIMNPGGPGSSGIDAVLRGGETHQSYTGSNFSIIGYDPRGVGLNMPYKCGPDRAMINQNPGQDPQSSGFFQNAFAYYSELASACDAEWGGSGTNSNIGRLISSTQSARDIKAIADKDGDKKLRYWGFAYGTVLGATIARLFPSNITAMMLGGNVNPNDWYRTNGPPTEQANDIDSAVQNFFTKCAAVDEVQSANQCAWTTPTSQQRTAANLLAKFDGWVGAEPLAPNRSRDGSLPTAQALSPGQSYVDQFLLFEALRSPGRFSAGDRVLQYWYDERPEPHRLLSTSIVRLLQYLDHLKLWRDKTQGHSIPRRPPVMNESNDKI